MRTLNSPSSKPIGQFELTPRVTRLTVFTILSTIFAVTALQTPAFGHPPSANLPAISLESADNEPPQNPYLAYSHWPMCHRNPYNQASSPYPGPTSPSESKTSFVEGHPCPITLAVSNPYPDGRRAVWGVTTKDVFKLDTSGKRLNYLAKDERFTDKKDAISGAYSLIDIDGTFFVPYVSTLQAYRDEVRDDPHSPIQKWKSYELPSNDSSKQDKILGINMTYDGRLILISESGLVIALTRELEDPVVLQLETKDPISNSFAIDETGGVFIVKSDGVVRVQWNPDAQGDARLTTQWSVPYRSDKPRVGRLGHGSGTSPSLMGVGSQDKFIVIGDGQTLMNLVLIWRDEIPSDWKGLEGRDRRIAAEVPVTFGVPDTKESTTEQSLTVRGYGVAAVSNLYGNIPPLRPRLAKRIFGNRTVRTIYRSNYESVAPYGVEKFVWNPQTRKLVSAWGNPNLSVPNGIPTMSEATGLMYGIGQRESDWTLEAIDWNTGDSVFFERLTREVRHNSFWAATEIGPDGTIITGMYGGIMRFGKHADPSPTREASFETPAAK